MQYSSIYLSLINLLTIDKNLYSSSPSETFLMRTYKGVSLADVAPNPRLLKITHPFMSLFNFV